MDCPIHDPTESETTRSGAYEFRDYNTGSCDPYTDSFATVACGTSAAAGTHWDQMSTAQVTPQLQSA